ncbi:MAG: serine hydrolase domain-containing protein [Bacteroidales bacterium]|nr:serine hydrolase domain-containing protein [Bacteroidales bacterium]
MIRLIATIFAVTTVFSLGARDLSATIDSLIDARYDGDSAPGGAVIIARGDSVLYERYIGLADMPSRRPIDADTRFCIASISKQFTVMALLQRDAAYHGPMPLLDTPVSDWFDYRQPLWRDITLRNLANHTSGVADSRPRDNRDRCVYADDESSIAYFPTVDSVQFGAGEYYDYLNPSFILLARVVERLSGKEFTEYMRDSVFEPAGMLSTYYFDPADDAGPDRSHGYIPGDDGGWREYDYGEETFFATRPDGGIYSTARDLLRWENALRDGVVTDPQRLAMAYRPSVSVTDSPTCDYQRRPDTWYGLGFFVDHPSGKARKVYHTGDNGGYQAYLAKYPDLDIKIIVLENRNDRDRWQLATAIDEALGLR